MLRIKYNNEFIDLAAGQDGELEANSPVFLVDNVLAEYSTPITIVYSDKNVRLIGPLFFNPTVRKKTKLEVELYKGDTYRCNAALVIESAGLRRIPRNSNAGGFLLTGISAFFTLVKDVLLEHMELGHAEAKPFTTYDAYDGSDGAWQMIHASWAGNWDWVVAPVRNDNFLNDPDNPTAWMNQMGRGEDFEPRNELKREQYITPFLRLKPVLKGIFESVGWTYDDSAIADAGYDKLFLFQTRWSYAFFNGNYYGFGFAYSLLMPQNTKASAFILAICKRYGWIPLCNAETRTCTMLPLKNCDGGALKDWTQYADQDVDADFSEDEKVYSFKNNYTGDDAAIDDADISGLRQETVASKFNLPAPTVAYDNAAVFAYRENKYYVIELDENNDRIWVPKKDNIYNDEPENENGTVETDCGSMPMIFSRYADNVYWGLFPYCSVPYRTNIGIRTFFYHGMVKEVTDAGAPGVQNYPFLSSGSDAPDGTVINEWANYFKHVSIADVDNGIEQHWFAKWMQYMKNTEVKTQNFNLPLHELVQFQWTDRILVNNIPHLVISFTEKLNMRAFIQAKLKRLIVPTEA